MATEAQYQFFKGLYDAEQARYRELIDRGKLFLSIITIYLGLLSVAADKTIPKLDSSLFAKSAYVVSVMFIIIAMALVVLAVGIFKYEYPSDPQRIIESFKDVPPTDDDFRDERIIDFTVATKRNFSQNEMRARLLRLSSFMLLLGALGQAIFFIRIAAY
ncbi:MAG: hypothetical protein SF097_27320 [Acidobacteriota bacterium]|nr:hypothetical protein [Acidobacteriota bacterium]